MSFVSAKRTFKLMHPWWWRWWKGSSWLMCLDLVNKGLNTTSTPSKSRETCLCLFNLCFPFPILCLESQLHALHLLLIEWFKRIFFSLHSHVLREPFPCRAAIERRLPQKSALRFLRIIISSWNIMVIVMPWHGLSDTVEILTNVFFALLLTHSLFLIHMLPCCSILFPSPLIPLTDWEAKRLLREMFLLIQLYLRPFHFTFGFQSKSWKLYFLLSLDSLFLSLLDTQ